MINASTVKGWAQDARELADTVGGRFFHDLATNLEAAHKHLEDKEAKASDEHREKQHGAKPKHR